MKTNVVVFIEHKVRARQIVGDRFLEVKILIERNSAAHTHVLQKSR